MLGIQSTLSFWKHAHHKTGPFIIYNLCPLIMLTKCNHFTKATSMYGNKLEMNFNLCHTSLGQILQFLNCDFWFALWILYPCSIRPLQFTFHRRPVPDQISELNSGACSPPSAVTATCSSSTNWRCDSHISTAKIQSPLYNKSYHKPKRHSFWTCCTELVSIQGPLFPGMALMYFTADTYCIHG